jgi:hypothetical protein
VGTFDELAVDGGGALDTLDAELADVVDSGVPAWVVAWTGLAA